MAEEKLPHSKKILLITNIERGEANVFLAMSHALLQNYPHVELHFATFKGFETAVTSTWQHARRTSPKANQITLHEIKGPPMANGVQHYYSSRKIPSKGGYPPNSFLAPPGLSNTTRAIHDTIPILVPYDGPQLVDIFTSIVEIINQVDADLVVVNSLMTPALTACYHLGIKFACLSPNAIKDFAAPSQPHGASLWKYPALFSGFNYPVPWYLIPFNVFFVLYVANAYIKDGHRRDVAKHLAAHTGATLRTPVDLIRNPPPDVKILVSTLPELDFPAVLPHHVIPCGPIIRNAPPISEADPNLEAWLSRLPTIYINLGSICLVDEEGAAELALALKAVMEKVQQQAPTLGFQVLWKLKRHGEYKTVDTGCTIHEILGNEIDADLVRIVDWVLTEPITILESGNVVCSVHHGGANSYNEAVMAGIPQVVLPQWTDCYDYAQRVEMLGIGRLGNRKAKPKWTAQELSRELSEVLLGKDSEAMKRKAMELADVCRRNGSGAANAARILLAESYAV
ncbi:Uncharacterized protein TCAP_04541 [Tolypocladium capitatum]|uniref:Erythromycin biosynthesis protein CIII-like C-terminal domain-containing protein n=1 Tax=Tolypocladium capitatum TaxID=45235 RepID=A0A2K3QDA4_9HYPO|nr:Uncharacterized protein TCAP_04541 [Tolypocladium capitatum]